MATHAISVARTAVSVTRAASLVTFLAIATRTRALVTGSDWKEAYIVGLSAIFTDYNIADAAATSTGLVIAIRPILDLVIATPTSNATTARSLATSPPNAPKAPPTKSARTARPAIHSLYWAFAVLRVSVQQQLVEKFIGCSDTSTERSSFFQILDRTHCWGAVVQVQIFT